MNGSTGCTTAPASSNTVATALTAASTAGSAGAPHPAARWMPTRMPDGAIGADDQSRLSGARQDQSPASGRLSTFMSKAEAAAARGIGPATPPRDGGSNGTRPAPGLSVNSPSHVPGSRMEPPMSVPTCSGPYPPAAAAPAPELEPPVVQAGFQGLRVMPCRLETPDDSIPQSGMTVDPRTTPPDSRSRAVTGASMSGTTGTTPAVPQGIGTPLRAMFSLRVTGTPSTGPRGTLAAQRCSLACASLRDSSGSRLQNAFSSGS